MQIKAVPLIQNSECAIRYLFTENVLVRKIAETHDTIFLSLRDIIIKSDVTLIHLASRNLCDVLRMHKVQGHGEMREPLYICLIYMLCHVPELKTVEKVTTES